MDLEHMSKAGAAAARRAAARRARASKGAADQDLRCACEDDDGYDPYCDYMDAKSASLMEEPEEDPWK